MASYRQGTGITLAIAFTRQSDGLPVDPTTVTCVVKQPNRTMTTYQYGQDSNLTRTGTGKYECYIVGNSRGTWRYRVVGSGNIDAVEERSFEILPTTL